jgi:hypothetical protein
MHNSQTYKRQVSQKERATTPRWIGPYNQRKEDPHEHLQRQKNTGYGREPANDPMKIPFIDGCKSLNMHGTNLSYFRPAASCSA